MAGDQMLCEWCHQNPVDGLSEINGETLATCRWCVTE